MRRVAVPESGGQTIFIEVTEMRRNLVHCVCHPRSWLKGTMERDLEHGLLFDWEDNVPLGCLLSTKVVQVVGLSPPLTHRPV